MNIFQRAISCGISVLPCNGKIPAINNWSQFMHKLPTTKQAEYWSGNIGVICGKVSGGISCIDFDVKNGNKFDEWILLMDQIAPDLLSNTYIETTPSGGYHVVYRSVDGIKNMKLAMNTDGNATIETRGEGGYFVCAPSIGYAVYYGKMSELIGMERTDEMTLLGVAESLTEKEKVKYTPKNKAPIEGDTVFNRYDSANDPIGLLQKHGWTIAVMRNDNVLLRRPGKNHGISASWNVIPNRFYCFSTSTAFEVGHVYKTSAVYSILEHGGDFGAAARALRKLESR
jgi:hypothetical protein